MGLFYIMLEERSDSVPASTSKYKPEYDGQAYRLCLLGHTDKDLAKSFEVEEQTINNWKKDHPSFFESILNGREKADGEVVQSLYHRAMGYSAKATKFATHEGKITDAVEYMEHYPPDTNALRYWLGNRNPKRWRDKQEIEHTGGNITIVANVPRPSDKKDENPDG